MWRKDLNLQEKVDQRVSIRGVAHNAKAGAIILADGDQVVYINGRKEWPEAQIGKRIVVTGVLRRQRVYPDVKVENGATSQGLPGEQFALELDDLN